jgi:mono/diheme cytochrome c family protein
MRFPTHRGSCVVGFWLALVCAIPVLSVAAETKPDVVNAVQAAAHPIVPGFERFYTEANSDKVQGGRLLLGELNCTSCHKAEKGVLGAVPPKKSPNLSQVGSRAKPAWIRAFLADPHAVKPGTMMPDVFNAQTPAEKAKQIEALVHFLASAGSGRLTDQIPDKASVARGEILFHQVGCVGCHAPQKGNAPAIATTVPLGELTKKYTTTSLATFIRDPLAVRPSGRMPSLNLDEKEARDVATYLLKDVVVPPNLAYQYFEGNWDRLPDFGTMKPKETGKAAGFDIELAKRPSNVGLRFEGFLHIDREGEYNFHLNSDDGSRLSIDGRVVVDNDGVHPPSSKNGKVRLGVGSHAIIVDSFNGGGGYELSVEFEGPGLARRDVATAVSLDQAANVTKSDNSKDEKAFLFDPELAGEGRKLFGSLGCASCHELREGKQQVASTLTSPALKELAGGRGCLSVSPAGLSPRFVFSARQRESLRAALDAMKLLAKDVPPPTPKEVISQTLTAFNCYACHVRDNVGGVETARNDWFQTNFKEMGDEGRIPPHLNGVGGKLTNAYLKTLFNQGGRDRPYILTRMPRFGGDNLASLTTAFETADPTEPLQRPQIDAPPYRIKADGRMLVGGKAFSCIKCHNFGKYKGEGVQAIDLTVLASRLKPEWVFRYLKDAQSYRPGTRMPNAWPKQGKSFLPAVLDGDVDKQIEAVWVYLSDGPKAAVPFGVLGQAMELLAQTEPVMYRNFIQGAGPRAIGVGYPEKVNLAFDANNLRLALVWHNSFIDASLHWQGRGVGFQGPLGDHTLALTDGAPLAQLADDAAEWPKSTAKEQGYQFRGYELDSARRPKFLYDFQAIHVEDFPQPMKEDQGTGLVRTLSFATDQPVENLWFRAAAAGDIKQLKDGWYSIDGVWKMRIEGSAKQTLVVRKSGDKVELLAPVEFVGKKATIVQTFDW